MTEIETLEKAIAKQLAYVQEIENAQDQSNGDDYELNRRHNRAYKDLETLQLKLRARQTKPGGSQ